MAYDVPELGVYFTPNDPASVQPQGSKSPFYGRLNKFNTVQWAVKVFQSDNYSIYRFIQLTAPIGYQQQPPTSRGKAAEGVAGEADGDPVTGTRRAQPWIKPLWLSTWPLWTLLVFASLAAVRLLPAGYARAAVAAPILLMVPGSLTLGAVFNQRRRPRGLVFVCYAALLSVVLVSFRLAGSLRGRSAHHGRKHVLVPARGLGCAGHRGRGAAAARAAGKGSPSRSQARGAESQTSLTPRPTTPRRQQPLGVRAITPSSRSWPG